MLSDMGWDVICISRDIPSSRDMLPDKEFSNEQVFNFGDCCIELNPLQAISLVLFHNWHRKRTVLVY